MIFFGACAGFGDQQGDGNQRIMGPEPIQKNISVSFYNVENLFDTEDDPLTADEDFTPDGKYNWTNKKYGIKLENIAKVIESMDADIIGLAEVENRKVLEDLVDQELIRRKKYQIVHAESRDPRGIDVALLYNPEAFQYVRHKTVRPRFPKEPGYRTRDILVVEGMTKGAYRVYFAVNHWPSRRGGQEETEERRLSAARSLKVLSDSIHREHRNRVNMVLMGDFNDDPDDKSITWALGAWKTYPKLRDDGFYNPMFYLHKPEEYGTLTYKGKWNLFDQFIVSEDLTKADNPLTYVMESAQVYRPQWIQVGFGRSREAPRRAIFRGEFVKEGFSDHFPIMMKLKVQD
ncbi:MAG: endonuclease/exonuclease/phosphatase family protein [Bacteroidota bacterium]